MPQDPGPLGRALGDSPPRFEFDIVAPALTRPIAVTAHRTLQAAGGIKPTGTRTWMGNAPRRRLHEVVARGMVGIASECRQQGQGSMRQGRHGQKISSQHTERTTRLGCQPPGRSGTARALAPRAVQLTRSCHGVVNCQLRALAPRAVQLTTTQHARNALAFHRTKTQKTGMSDSSVG